MNPIGTLIRWGKDALHAILGGASDITGVLRKVWGYVTNVHNVFAWLLGGPELRYILSALYHMSIVHLGVVAIRDTLRAIAGWIWATMVRPVRDALNRRISQLAAWIRAQLIILRALVITLYRASLAYTRQQVGIERSARIKAIQAEHAAMLKAVAACLATVQRQAAGGYNSVNRERLNLIARLLNDVADRQPEVKGLVTLLVKSVVDLETVDNPVLRFGISKLLTEIVGRLGVDRVTGDLIGRLLGPWTAGGRPGNLSAVERDVALRLNALEDQWAEFMAAGGPEVEQAGREWRDISGLVTDAAILGMFTLGVTDPAVFARGVADTIGIAGNDALDAIVRVIRVR